MGRKKKFQFTAVELASRNGADKLCGITDKQLFEEFHRAAEPTTKTGVVCDEGITDVQKLLNALAAGKCKGVKGGIAYKVSQFAKEMGLI